MAEKHRRVTRLQLESWPRFEAGARPSQELAAELQCSRSALYEQFSRWRAARERKSAEAQRAAEGRPHTDSIKPELWRYPSAAALPVLLLCTALDRLRWNGSSLERPRCITPLTSDEKPEDRYKAAFHLLLEKIASGGPLLSGEESCELRILLPIDRNDLPATLIPFIHTEVSNAPKE